MLFPKPRAYYESIATLTGCIIGAGVLGIPYVVIRSGFWTGILMMVILGLATLILHLLIGEITLRTRECHQLVGYAEKYLGKKGKYLMMASMVIGVYGALVAYTLGVSQSLTLMFGGPQYFWAIAYYSIMSILVFGGVGILGKSELLMETIKFIVFTSMTGALLFSKHFTTLYFQGFSIERLMLPYGVILFAFIGTAAIPSIREEMKKCLHLTKRAILIGSLIPLACYVIFTIATIGISGFLTTEVATVGLTQFVGPFGFVLLNLFAVLAMATSFHALGYALKTTYILDFKLPHIEAWALVISIPAVIILLGARSFVQTLDMTGTFAGGLAGILIVLTHKNAQKQSERHPEYTLGKNTLIYASLIGVFILGMAYQLFLLV